MNCDAQLQFQNVLITLRNDPRLSGFQGLHFNRDGSLMAIDRWGGHYHANLEALMEWLRAGVASQEVTHEIGNAA